MSSEKKEEEKEGEEELSPLQISSDTELIEITDKKFKFINCKFKKPKQKMFGFDFDVKLRAGSHVYQAHREVLSNASVYFEAMFNSNFREKDQDVIELHDLPPLGFDALLEYFYRGYITISDENVGQVVEAARFFQSEWLLAASRVFLLQHFVFADSEEALAIAETYDLGDLWDSAFQFLGNNFEAFIQRGTIARVKLEVFLAFLKSDSFVCVSERDILTTILKFWADNRGLKPLLSALRLPLLAKEDFQTIREALDLDVDPKKKKKEKKKKSKEKMTKEEKKADEAALKELESSLKAAEEADINSFFASKARGSRAALVVLSAMDHNVILQFVRPGQCREPVCLELDTSGDAPVTWDSTKLLPMGQQLVCMGGYDAKFCSSRAVSAFSPSSVTWRKLVPMLEPRVSHAAAVTPQGLVVVGGVKRAVNSSGSDVETFLSHAELFSGGKWRKLPPLPKALFDLAATCLGSELYVSGGISDLPSDSIPCADVFRLDLAEQGGSWKRLPPLACQRQHHVMISHSGKVFVFGGTTVPDSGPDDPFGQPEPCLSNEVFDPQAGVWAKLPETPAEYKRVFAPHAVVGDFVYLCTGDAEVKYLRCFHLTAQKWLTMEGEPCVGDVCTHLAYMEVGLPE